MVRLRGGRRSSYGVRLAKHTFHGPGRRSASVRSILQTTRARDLTLFSATEDFSYFTLLKPATPSSEPTTLFGISCTRQLAATALLHKPADVTRSTVQKAVVVIADSPHLFGMLRERLSVVTSAWFAQRDFTETEILKRFQESLREEAERGRLEEGSGEDRDQYLGMSLRQLIREFKWQTLVLFKCCLLQPKVSLKWYFER